MQTLANLMILVVPALAAFSIMMHSINRDKRQSKAGEELRSLSLAALIKKYLCATPENTWWSVETDDDSIIIELVNIHDIELKDRIVVYVNGNKLGNWKIKDELVRTSQALLEKYDFMTLNKNINLLGE